MNNVLLEQTVSIVVPIYNLEKVLPKCVNSLIRQTYRELDIILVNDGSTDNSLKICETFAKRDKRIRVINQENKGVESARIEGYNEATGTYIMFVDGDDWLPKNAVEKLIEKAEKTNADIVIGSMTRVLDRFGIISKSTKMNEREIMNQELMKKYYISFFGVNILPVNMCAKLYKKELLDKLQIPLTGLKHAEDLCFNMHVFPYANKIVTISENVYYYRWGGMTNRMNYGLFDDARKAYRIKMDMLDKFEVSDARRFTAIELKNFALTYAESFILYTNLSCEEMRKYVLCAIQTEEMKNALGFLTEKDLINEKTQAIACGDAKKVLDLLYPDAVKKRRKRKVLNCISRLLVSA